MKVYNYCPVTREYLSVSTAQENPLKKGSFLFPQNSTDVEPPIYKEGFARIWVGNKWSYLRDLRNTDVYSTETGEKADRYKEIGGLPSSLTEKVPPEYPKWNGTEWEVDKEKKLSEETQILINELKSDLSRTDYQVIKIYEQQLAGKTAEYDIRELHKERQQIRDEINELEELLK